MTAPKVRPYAHPQARPDCENCDGRGWRLGFRTSDDHYAIERCDECLYAGRIPEDKRIHDADVVPLALEAFADAGTQLSAVPTYPCYVIRTCCLAPINHELVPGAVRWLARCSGCGLVVEDITKVEKHLEDL